MNNSRCNEEPIINALKKRTSKVSLASCSVSGASVQERSH
jgi:hypothetical protein